MHWYCFGLFKSVQTINRLLHRAFGEEVEPKQSPWLGGSFGSSAWPECPLPPR